MKNKIKKSTFIFLTGALLVFSHEPILASEVNHFCSVFTDEGKLTHRICDDAGSVTLKAYYPEDLKVKNFSWDCQAENVSGKISGSLDEAGRIKLISSTGKIGLLTMFSRQEKLYYFWAERGEEKIVPCGQANWFTCKNSPAIFWFASSEQNGSNFKAKKIQDLRDYPYDGLYAVPTEKNLLLIWAGNNEWNSFSAPAQLNVGRINLNDSSYTAKKEESGEDLSNVKDAKSLSSLMINKSLLTKEEIDLKWQRMDNGPLNLELPQESFKLESLNEAAGGSALFLELKKKISEEDDIIEENQGVDNPSEEDGGKEKTCFYDQPGAYRPSLKIEYEDGNKTTCAPIPIIEVSSKIGCQIRVKKTDSKDRYAEKLKIYLGDGLEARIDGECLESFEPKWTVYGANSANTSDNKLAGRNVKLLPLAGADPSVKAAMENEETGEVLQCKEAEIVAREKLRWR